MRTLWQTCRARRLRPRTSRPLVEDARRALALLQRTVTELERRLDPPTASDATPDARPQGGVPKRAPTPATAVRALLHASWDGEGRRHTVVAAAATSLFVAFFSLIAAMVLPPVGN